MNYDVVIGIEIHCELKTKTKMFSGAPTSFGAVANSCVNEIDLGHPGILPCVNKEAVKSAVKVCHALQLEIDPLVKFDRKNYYYTDLPKGFQITQQFYPIGSNGYVEFEVEGEKKKIRINRLHMEEDTAKQFHLESETLIDYNRAGTPLIEIVSEPDMTNGKEAVAYVSALQEILLYLGVSDVKMEEGSMRCDVNISLMPKGSSVFGTKVEVKNLNSLSNVQKAIEFEMARQSEMLNNNELIVQETRRYDETSKSTVSMRKKEGAVDYKYFPEANIFPIMLDQAWIDEIKGNLPEMPKERRERYIKDYGLSNYDAAVLVANRELSSFYEEVIKHTKEYKAVANYCIGDLTAILSKNNMKVSQCTCQPSHLAEMIEMIKDHTISSKQAKEIFPEVVEGKNPKQLVEEKGMKQMSDSSALLSMIESILDEYPQSIEDFKNGKDRAVGFLVGQVMKKSKGQANPAMTNQLIVEELKKR